MAACTLVYISARSSASKPSFSSPQKWAWYFSGSSSFKSCSPSPRRESVLLSLETFLWVKDSIICKKLHLKVVLGARCYGSLEREKLNLHVVSNVTTLMYLRWVSAFKLLSSLLKPANLFSLWGMSKPPSKAPCIKKVIRVMLIKLNYFLISGRVHYRV